MDDQTNIRWPDTIYDHLKRVGVRQVGYVPDAGHSPLIELVCGDPQIIDTVLTTEEAQVAMGQITEPVRPRPAPRPLTC